MIIPRNCAWTFRLTAVLLVVLFCRLGQIQAAQTPPQGPAKEVPELQVLTCYVGSWEVVMALGEAPTVPIAKGKSTSKWILDGRFLEQTGTIQEGDNGKSIKVTTLMTFDVEKKTYRSWTFTSNGQATEQEGKWDPATQTMTSTSCATPGITVTTTANFAEAGIEKWKITTMNGAGVVLRTVVGKNTRQRE